jgi:hypothetical protein
MGRFSVRSTIIAAIAATLVVASLPVAASVGDAILAGMTTWAPQQTALKGNVDTANLKVVNLNPDGSAARFVVQSGNPPFTVNSPTRVGHLNADRLDGVHAAGFLKKTAYDPDKDGTVTGAAAAIRYHDGQVYHDGAAGSSVDCVTGPVTLGTESVVVAEGEMALTPIHPIGTHTPTVRGWVVTSLDGGSTWDIWDNLSAIAMLHTGEWSAIPVGYAGVLPAGTYTLGIDNGLAVDLGDGYDYLGACRLTITVYPGVDVDYAAPLATGTPTDTPAIHPDATG